MFLVISEFISYRDHYIAPSLKNILLTIFNFNTLSIVLMVLLAILFVGLLSTASFKDFLHNLPFQRVAAIFIGVILLRSINLVRIILFIKTIIN